MECNETNIESLDVVVIKTGNHIGTAIFYKNTDAH